MENSSQRPIAEVSLRRSTVERTVGSWVEQMRGHDTLFYFLLTILLPPSASAQQQRSSNGTLRGTTIDHPERMSGSWEVRGEYAIYGLHIQLTTKVDGAPATLIGVR